jgi:hypothetical protein
VDGPRVLGNEVTLFLELHQGTLCLAYGYGVNEVPGGPSVSQLKVPKEGLKVKKIRPSPEQRAPVSCSLGPHNAFGVCPKPDLDDMASTLAGVMKRGASRHPEPECGALEELGEYVDEMLPTMFEPLAAGTDVTVETWVLKTNYPEWRKKELLDCYYKFLNSGRSRFARRYQLVKFFNKDEPYLEYKFNRGIYSRTDEFKCFVGPFFKAIEEVVYKHPAFIKHVPVNKRAEYIRELFLGMPGETDATDYTAFESQFTAKVMKMVEVKLYRYMTQHLPDRKIFWKHLNVLTGKQNCTSKYLDIELPTCRMSGEMCTSLGNSFSNLMFAMFVATKKGATEIKIVVEGDDGLLKHNGAPLLAEDFARLGLTIKMEHHDRLETASFCGLIFDSEEVINLTDPRKVLTTFGWGDRKYSRSRPGKKLRLLRAKSLSLAWQYPGCPIISELAQYGLRVTSGVNIGSLNERSNDWWKREIGLQAQKDERKLVYRDPGPRSRALVEELWGVSIEAQLGIEKYLREKTDLGPLRSPWILINTPIAWSDYASRFVRYVRPGYERIEPFPARPAVTEALMALIPSAKPTVQCSVEARLPSRSPIEVSRCAGRTRKGKILVAQSAC